MILYTDISTATLIFKPNQPYFPKMDLVLESRRIRMSRWRNGGKDWFASLHELLPPKLPVFLPPQLHPCWSARSLLLTLSSPCSPLPQFLSLSFTFHFCSVLICALRYVLLIWISGCIRLAKLAHIYRMPLVCQESDMIQARVLSFRTFRVYYREYYKNTNYDTILMAKIHTYICPYMYAKEVARKEFL